MDAMRWSAILGVPRQYLFYRRLESVTRAQVETLLRALDLDLAGRSVLELGPGAGVSLDVFVEHGASVRFIDRHPLYTLECRRRGHRGRRADFLALEALHGADAFDVVYARGSISPESFGDGATFRRWLDAIEGVPLALLSPWYEKGDRPDWFVATLADAGYASAGWIEGYAVEDIYPDLWVRSSDGSVPIADDTKRVGQPVREGNNT